MASSITICCCGDNISSPVKNSYLSIFPDDNADIFAAALLMSNCRFSSLSLFQLSWLLSILVTLDSFGSIKHYLKEDLYQWPKLCVALWYISVELFKVFKVNLRWMIILSLMKLLTDKCVLFSLMSIDTRTYDCMMNTRETFSFLPLMKSSVTIWLSFLLLIISAVISPKTMNTFHFFPAL